MNKSRSVKSLYKLLNFKDKKNTRGSLNVIIYIVKWESILIKRVVY